jgi:L-ascorbate metabolism protein UlaG (beta-lactamase superfamily)
MRLTKLVHACVLVEEDDTRILIDPGSFTQGFEDLDGVDAVLITHQHADHVDVDRLGVLLERNPVAALYSDEGTASVLADRGFTAEIARAGDRLPLGVPVEVFGTNHAIIHPDIPMIPNVGYLIGGRFFHPGDSFTVPDEPVDVLGLPTGAPWLKVSEAVDYVRTVAPRVAVPIHEAALARPSMHYGIFDKLALPGTTVTVVEPGSSTEL